MTKKETIGFIGLGVMGNSMAKHLLDNDYPLHVFTRTKTKAKELIEAGAVWEDDVAGVASKADIIITIIGTPEDVDFIYFGKEGIFAHAKQGAILVDMTTSKPSLARKIHEKAKALKMDALDAPVSGGDVGARYARLTIMVGGEQAVFDKVKPIFELLGSNIVLQGEAGAGQHTKAVNQIAIAPMMIGLCEALVYAEKAGLKHEDVLKSISTGAAGSWSLDNYGPRIITGDFSPGFAIKHFMKDMRIAIEAAKEMNMPMPGVGLALRMYEELTQTGIEEEGIHALIKYYDW